MAFRGDSFTNGKSWIVTKEDLSATWGRGGALRCCMCGYVFLPGDAARWQYTNNVAGAEGNPIVCEACDGPDVVERWKQMHELARTKFWWFTQCNCD